MNRTLSNLGAGAIVALAIGGIWACTHSTAPAASAAPAPTDGARRNGPTPTRTPSNLARTNPNIVEEDEVHFVERFPKDEYIRVDATHFKSPVVPLSVAIYKEDDKYYYAWTEKRIPELVEQERANRLLTPTPEVSVRRTPVAPLADFEDLAPLKGSGSVRFEELPNTGLPDSGLWRASFVMADMNGDGILDIVAPPPRLGGDSKPRIWLGDGKGHYRPWTLTFKENGKVVPDFPVGYGGIAAGDIDGDGKMDFATASHNGGIVAFFGDGQGTFEVSRRGLPGKDFSGQAVALVDVNGDGKLDIVASRDVLDNTASSVDLNQVRTYLYRAPRSFEFRNESLRGAAYSYSMNIWDFDKDGRVDLLLGSHYYAAQTMVWRNEGNGGFSPIAFPELESYAYHFATRPGTFGRDHVPAFVDAYDKFMTNPGVSAIGINVYSYSAATKTWQLHRVFRKKDARTFLYAIAMGDVNGDGLDDIVFPDSDLKRIRIFLQTPAGEFREVPESQEPPINSQAQCIRLADVNGDGKLDLVIAKSIPSSSPSDPGGWSVYINQSKR